MAAGAGAGAGDSNVHCPEGPAPMESSIVEPDEARFCTRATGLLELRAYGSGARPTRSEHF